MNSLKVSENPQGYAIPHTSRTIPDTNTFTVRVTRFDDVWFAECDRLGLVTEADDYATLRERARRIVPELAEMNGLDVTGQSIRLQF
uniref:DUF1902 domain-containing protein n=1 Tax=Candidatus Kentrum sp. FW TaxID=2126338 RepID=A0A450SBS9_9GAMM|nr:MAG: protein of unknown function (DUF1902) [Candidatus Kentron sp. FW]